MLPDYDFLHDLPYQNDCLCDRLPCCGMGMLTVAHRPGRAAGLHRECLSGTWKCSVFGRCKGLVAQRVHTCSFFFFEHAKIRVKSSNQTMMTNPKAFLRFKKYQHCPCSPGEVRCSRSVSGKCGVPWPVPQTSISSGGAALVVPHSGPPALWWWCKLAVVSPLRRIVPN